MYMVGAFFLAIAGVAIITWGCLVLLYSDTVRASSLKIFLSVLYAAVGLWALSSILFFSLNILAVSLFSLSTVVIVARWKSIKPSNEKDWIIECERLAKADIDDDRVTVHNIRNFEYINENESIPGYYSKVYDVSQLCSVDMVSVYWRGPGIAHTFLSFGFQNGDYLAISIEIRKAKNDSHSTIKGLFKQFELYYAVTDERDAIRVRTNYRVPEEEVYLFRVKGTYQNGKRLFMEYMRRINSLNKSPEFYHTLTNNCTTGIWINSKINPGHVRISWKIIVSGYLPQYLYDMGVIDNSLPFEELKRLSLVNEKAKKADNCEDFSIRIREGLPGISITKNPQVFAEE